MVSKEERTRAVMTPASGGGKPCDGATWTFLDPAIFGTLLWKAGGCHQGSNQYERLWQYQLPRSNLASPTSVDRCFDCHICWKFLMLPRTALWAIGAPGTFAVCLVVLAQPPGSEVLPNNRRFDWNCWIACIYCKLSIRWGCTVWVFWPTCHWQGIWWCCMSESHRDTFLQSRWLLHLGRYWICVLLCASHIPTYSNCWQIILWYTVQSTQRLLLPWSGMIKFTCSFCLLYLNLDLLSAKSFERNHFNPCMSKFPTCAYWLNTLMGDLPLQVLLTACGAIGLTGKVVLLAAEKLHRSESATWLQQVRQEASVGCRACMYFTTNQMQCACVSVHWCSCLPSGRSMLFWVTFIHSR